MLNRSNTAPAIALDARRALAARLRELVRQIPPAPCAWSGIDWEGLFAGASADTGLGQLSRLYCDAAGRVTELRGLWNESIATAAFAWRIAPHLGAEPAASATAGLLHRLGDALTLRALASIEESSGMRVDAAAKANLCAEHANTVLDEAVRVWQVPTRAAAMASGWRRLRDFPAVASDAAVVHLARFMAIERVSPRFCAPGMVESAAEELKVDAGVLREVRAATRLESLLV